MTRDFLVLVVSLCFALFSCSTRPVPDGYGMYVESEKGLTPLMGQTIVLKGNILKAIGGIEGPSGFECERLKTFVVHQQGVQVNLIKVSQLKFLGGANLPAGPFGSIKADMQFWVPNAPIDCTVKPVEGKKDMYYVQPTQPLATGLYALYFYSFDEMPPVTLAYDVVVGKKSDFPSYSTKREQDRGLVRREAERLLSAMNRIFNVREFGSLSEVYQPDGRPLSGEQLDKFKDGMRTLRRTAGAIVTSRIVTVHAAETAASGVIELDTNYETSGVQRERMRIQKVGEKFFITSLE